MPTATFVADRGMMLVEMSFLCVKPDGSYARLSDGADHPRPHPATADLSTGTRFLRVS
jgi:hypothetical protein